MDETELAQQGWKFERLAYFHADEVERKKSLGEPEHILAVHKEQVKLCSALADTFYLHASAKREELYAKLSSN